MLISVYITPVMFADPNGDFAILLFATSLFIGGIIGGISSMISKDSDETWCAAFLADL